MAVGPARFCGWRRNLKDMAREAFVTHSDIMLNGANVYVVRVLK